MKKTLILLLLIGVAIPDIICQDKHPAIRINAVNVPFSTFAGDLRINSGIYIYYKPEWIANLRVTAAGDSVSVTQLLESVLKPAGIHFIYQGNGQYFLTGTEDLSGIGKPGRAGPIPAGHDSATTKTDIPFGMNSYERTIRKVTIGAKNNKPGTGCYLSGRITNRSNGEPVIGATIVLDGSGIGVITDMEGTYSLPMLPGKDQKITVSCLGMFSCYYDVEMHGSGQLNIEMDSRMIDVKEVIVRSDKHQNVRGLQMGFQSMGAREMKTVPMVMGERDIFKVANLMPGVQTIGEGAAGFNVRGSASDQNLFLINDIPVLNTGHLFGFFSAFNPDMVNGLNLYKGNFPAEYGGRLASVFDITTRKGNKKDFGARGSISPVTGSILIETPLAKDRSSLMVSARSTYSDWILDRLPDADVAGRQGSFSDIMAGVHVLGQNNSSWQVFVYGSRDKFSLSEEHEYHYENRGASVSHDKRLGNKWSVRSAAVFSNYSNYEANREQAARSFGHTFTVREQEFKMRFTGYPAARHKAGFGGNVILHNLNQGTRLPLDSASLFSPVEFGRENGLEYAIHASDEFTITDQLTLYAGLRYSLFNYLGPNNIRKYTENAPILPANISDTLSYPFGKTINHYSGPEYRASLNFQIRPDMSLKASYNRMRQYLFMLSNTISISPTDRWKLADPYIIPPVADQVSLGLYRNFTGTSIETSAEIYYKKVKNSIEYRDNADLSGNPLTETIILQGNQKAWGIELLMRKNSGRLTGWISYAFSRSMITVNGRDDWQKINMGLTYPANYDKPHALNIVGNLRLSRRLTVSSVLVYNTGRPVTYPTGYFWANGSPVVNYSLRNEYRMPDYFRTDLSLILEGNLVKKKFAHGSWVFSVYNLTGRKNPYSIYFVNEYDAIRGYKLSIYGVPIMTVSYLFKLGNYAVE